MFRSGETIKLLVICGSIVSVVAISFAQTTATTAPSTEGVLQTTEVDDADYDDFEVNGRYRTDVHDELSWSFLKQALQDETQENRIISPFSVKLILAQLLEAAGNNSTTQRQLSATQILYGTTASIRGFYKKTIRELNSKGTHDFLHIKTRYFHDTSTNFGQRYEAILETFYDTSVESVPFQDTEMAADLINQWCINGTSGQFQKNFVTPANIRENILLIANVNYFSGLWKRAFNYSETFLGVFYSSAAMPISQVPYLVQTNYHYYHDSDTMNMKILRLPYKKKFSMFIVLSKSGNETETFQQLWEKHQLRRLQWQMEEVEVRVILPKFQIEVNRDLKQTLQRLGIDSIFSNDASLPALARGSTAVGLKVSGIYQKIGFQINERGAEASEPNASRKRKRNRFVSSPVVEFNVNCPFIFFIEEDFSGAIVFGGKIMNPSI